MANTSIGGMNTRIGIGQYAERAAAHVFELSPREREIQRRLAKQRTKEKA